MTTLQDSPSTSVEPFHLISGATGDEVEAVIPLMWCVQPATTEWLVNERIENPYFLVSIVHDAGDKGEAAESYRYTEMDRYIVPLSVGMEYIRFRRPGINHVKATIVWGDNSHELRKSFKKKDGSLFKYNIIDPLDGELNSKPLFDWHTEDEMGQPLVRASLLGHFRSDHTTEKTFVVNAEAFGDPPPPLARTYYAKFGLYDGVDECANRGRTALWLLFPFFFLWTSIAKVAFYAGQKFFGVRGASISPLFHPFEKKISDTIDYYWDMRGNFWLEKKPTKKSSGAWITGDPRFPALWFLNPVTIMAFWGILSFLAAITHSRTHVHGKTITVDHWLHIIHLAWWQSLLWSVGLHVAIALLIVVGLVIAMAFGAVINAAGFGDLLDRVVDAWSARAAARRERRRNRGITALKSDLDTMSCEQIPAVVDYSSLPKSRRNYHLWFQGKKKGVCRPMAQ